MLCYYFWAFDQNNYDCIIPERVFVHFTMLAAGDSWHSSKIIRADEKNAGII